MAADAFATTTVSPAQTATLAQTAPPTQTAPPAQTALPTLTGALLDGIGHGFFTRAGGVSSGPFESLNCSVTSGDDPARLRENRARVAARLGVGPGRLLGVSQVHGTECVTVEHPWAAGEGPRADAMATRVPGLALGIITADCAPVLLADPVAGVVGAVHAGWRGAVAGVLEATVARMVALGASPDRLRAVVGPCIGQASYEVGEDLRQAVLASPIPGQAGTDATARLFAPGRRAGHSQFDLAGYCLARLHGSGLRAEALGLDTLAEPDRFFSHRRRTLAGGGPIGHQISAIVCPPATGAGS